MHLHGMLSFPLTPFTPDDTVDLRAYVAHLERQLAAGPSGLFVACGTGEFGALSPAEYRDLVRTAVRVTGGRVPVVAGTGGGPQPTGSGSPRSSSRAGCSRRRRRSRRCRSCGRRSPTTRCGWTPTVPGP